jgi:hypothetical protein
MPGIELKEANAAVAATLRHIIYLFWGGHDLRSSGSPYNNTLHHTITTMVHPVLESNGKLAGSWVGEVAPLALEFVISPSSSFTLSADLVSVLVSSILDGFRLYSPPLA